MGERLYGRAGHPNLALGRVHLGTALAQTRPARRRRLRAVRGRRRLLPPSLPLGPPARRRPGPAPGRSCTAGSGTATAPRTLLQAGPGTRPATAAAIDAATSRTPRRSPWAGSVRISYHAYLSASRDLPAAEQGRAYVGAWHAKGAVMRLLAERRDLRRLRLGKTEAAQGQPPPDEATELGRMWEELLDTDARLARLLIDDHEEPAVREGGPQHVGRRAMRSCSANSPAGSPRSAVRTTLGRLGPDDLARLLPVGSAFVDIVRYRGHPGRRRGRASLCRVRAHAAGGAASRELGPAAPIDEAVKKWRDAVTPLGPEDTCRAAEPTGSPERRGGAETASARLGADRGPPAARHDVALPGTRRRPGGPSLRRPPRPEGSYGPAGRVRHRLRTARPVPPGEPGAAGAPARGDGPLPRPGRTWSTTRRHPALPGSVEADAPRASGSP